MGLSLTLYSIISRTQDVDGFHVLNTGHLFKKGDALPDLIPCTPKGMLHMLNTEGINIAGKHCVVLGRSVSLFLLSIPHRVALPIAVHMCTSNFVLS